jgi:hypothetical protein
VLCAFLREPCGSSFSSAPSQIQRLIMSRS